MSRFISLAALTGAILAAAPGSAQIPLAASAAAGTVLGASDIRAGAISVSAVSTVGGPGAFVTVAQDIASFRASVLRKLVTEIALR